MDKGSFHDRFAVLRSTLLRDEDFGHWFDAEQGRRSIPPSVVAGAFLLALRKGCSDREAEQRMRYDLRWKWALGLGLNDHGCDHSSLCVFRARLLAHQEEGRLFREIVSRAVKAGLLTKRAVQVMDSSPMLGAAAVQDTYKLIRTALHKLVKGHKRELLADLMPRLKRYLQTSKADIDWEDTEARRRELQQLVADAELVRASTSAASLAIQCCTKGGHARPRPPPPGPNVCPNGKRAGAPPLACSSAVVRPSQQRERSRPQPTVAPPRGPAGLTAIESALIQLQRLAGNAAVEQALSPSASPTVQCNWPFSSAPARSNEELITAGAGGDTDAIVTIRDFRPATDEQRMRMVDALLGQFYVGSKSERALEAIWNSFGARLPAALSTPDMVRRFTNSCVRHGHLLERVPVAARIDEAFQGDVREVARGYLTQNAAFLTTESDRLGLAESAQPTAEQDRTIGGLQLAATEIAKLQLAQQAARGAFVGWGREVIADNAGINHWRRVAFDPERPAPVLSVPQESMETTFFWDDANERWADAYYDTDLLAREQAEVRPFDQIQRDYATVEATLTRYFTTYPTLFTVAQGGVASTTAFATADSPQAARQQLRGRFNQVRASIRDALAKLESGDLDPRDLTPIHQQLRAGTAHASSGVDYSTPLAQGLVARQVLDHNISRALVRLALQELSSAAFLLAPLTEGASMVLLMSAGTAASGVNLALDSARFQALLAAQRSSVVPGTSLVSGSEVDEARMAMEADAIAFALAALALGGAVAATTLQALRAVRRARLLRQIGPPSTVTLPDRAYELPYADPPGTIVVRAGQPLDFAALDPNQRYLWIVDVEGNIRICPEKTGGFFTARPVAKHGDLAAPTQPVPPQPSIPGAARRGAARAGGELDAQRGADGRLTGQWVMNNNSSYTFARDDRLLLSGESLDAVRRLMGTTGTDISRILTANTSGAQ